MKLFTQFNFVQPLLFNTVERKDSALESQVGSTRLSFEFYNLCSWKAFEDPTGQSHKLPGPG